MAIVHIKDDFLEQTYTVKVQINPLPGNCTDCPFYQYMGEGEYGEEVFNCILTDIKNNFGIAAHRYEGCPFDTLEGK